MVVEGISLTMYLCDYRIMAECERHRGQHGLVKQGISPEEIEDWVDRHLCELQIDVKQLRKLKYLKCAMKHLSIKATKKDPTKLDRRRRSTQYVADAECIPSLKEICCSAIKIEGDTSGRQGVTRFSNELPKSYHESQNALLKLENKLGRYKPNNSGIRWVDKTEDRELTTREFCMVIDSLTEVWKVKVDQHRRAVEETSLECAQHDKRIIRPIMRAVVKTCIHRILLQLIKENDLCTEDGWKDWREHTLVIVAFAAYATILDIYYHKRFDVCGFLDIANT